MNSLMNTMTNGEIAAGALERRIRDLEQRVAELERRTVKQVRLGGDPYDLNRVAGTKRRK